MKSTPLAKKLVIGKRSYSYYTTGDQAQPAVVLLHGISGSAHDMFELAEHFQQEGYRVVIPHLPGHYPDTDFLPIQAMDDLADWLEQFIKIVCGKNDPSMIIGNSFSAAIVYILASRDSFKASQYVMYCPGPYITRLARWLDRAVNSVPLDYSFPIYTSMLFGYIRVFFGLEQKKRKTVKALTASEKRKRHLDRRILKYADVLLRKSPYHDARYEISPETAKRCIVIFGAQDNIVHKHSVTFFEKRIGSNRVSIVNKCRHIIHIEAPEQAASLTISTLRGDKNAILD